METDKDLEQVDPGSPSLPFPGRRIWKWCWSGGLAIVSVCIVLSAFFSWGSYSDAPNHDYLLSVPILTGVLVMAIGASLFALSGYDGQQTEQRFFSRPRRTVVLVVVTVVVGAYLVNPLLSPVAFLRDSDLDSAQDYNDDFPHNGSRVDDPWAGFTAVYAHSSHTDVGWNVTIGSGVFSCWLDETGIKVLNPDNSTALELTLLQDFGDGVDGVRYFNLQKTDRMDEGDYFLLDASVFMDGSKVLICANTSYGWQVLQMAVL